VTTEYRGRFAPSPTGDLHVGNLRTAMIAWLWARHEGGRFLMRMEDLDRAVAKPECEARQLEDLRAIGIDWDGPVLRQSDHLDRNRGAIESLSQRGLVYRCYCTRAEIAEAASAPNSAVLPGAYPGTCRALTERERLQREHDGRPPALRLRATVTDGEFTDDVLGVVGAPIDDLVLCRNDGTVAYNLAVVVDDAHSAVTHVVRGDDLAPSTPRQLHLYDVLGLAQPRYAHLPLILGADGERLAKRHGAVTLHDLEAQGVSTDEVRSRLAVTLGLAEPGEHVTMDQLLQRFSPDRLPSAPEIWSAG
jgi:glutamyl-tRNA synthetase